MRKLLAAYFAMAVTAGIAQNYVSSSTGTPISRMSFLRSQSGTYDPALMMDFALIESYQQSAWLDKTGKYTATLGGIKGTTIYTGKIGPWPPYFNQSAPNYLTVSPTPTIPNVFTVAVWAHANALSGGYNRIVDAGYTHSFSLLTDSATSPTHYEFILNNQLDSNTCSGGTISTPTATGKAWPTNPWDFVAVTFNGTNATLYVNGTSVASGSSCAFTFTGSSMYTVLLGSCPDSTCNSDHWDGQLQGVRIWSRVLSSAEVSAIYAAENH